MSVCGGVRGNRCVGGGGRSLPWRGYVYRRTVSSTVSVEADVEVEAEAEVEVEVVVRIPDIMCIIGAGNILNKNFKKVKSRPKPEYQS